MRKSLSGLLILIFILTAAFSVQAQEDLAARMRQGLAENFNVDQVFYDNIWAHSEFIDDNNAAPDA